ncbi:MAG: hypothetical protein KBS34_00875, partial [Phascolarctobacterium sp.]|nr:hypothetical protein [Candidatus Phascolarctobacterium equi]
MKKSLACTVLAGLLAGCVMTGAEADTIDIVINADGTVTPSTYGGGYKGVYVSYLQGQEILDFENNINSIVTNGQLDTKTYHEEG